MYRVKYLFGIFSGIFGLLYLFFGIVGWEYARDFLDKYTAFGLCIVHSVAAALLFRSSIKDKRKEDLRLAAIIDNLLIVHPMITAEILAQESGMSLGDAHEYIMKTFPHQ